jgi:molybdate transport system substrate-binding protein
VNAHPAPWRALTSALAAALGACALAGCGAGSSSLEVSAAASLKKAFTLYATQFTMSKASFSFAGSDALAAQIEQGARPDVFASANVMLPAALYAKGLVERPVVFATNKLVLAVPASSSISDLAGIERPGVSVALGTPSVPVGAYSEKVIERLAPAQRKALLANVRDREPDVTGIVGKLLQGAADAGFLYATDVAATAGRLRAVDLPAALLPRVAYAAAVVRGSHHAAAARAFLRGLLAGPGRADLLGAGFLAAPGR